ncbi:ATP synthase F1 subunit gamma [Candidatus Sumerlaeota bacterium]|nr:ATP synthase F1 subunit gamma [Candidatus Sumerlaeota bacterium]
MAENLKALRRRIRSIGNTMKITRAMEMVSAAKLRRTQSILHAGQPYAEKLQELLQRLAGAAGDSDPLFARREAGRIAIVVFTGDRGLCGGFNNNLLQMAERWIKERGKDNVDVVCMGKKARDYLGKRGYKILNAHIDLGGLPEAPLARETANELRDCFLAEDYNRVFLLYNCFISQAQYEPVVEQFLPLSPDEISEEGDGDEQKKGLHAEVEYIYEPDQKQLFARLLPAYLESMMYITLAQSMTAEHSARMMAMNNATKNCGELIDSLTLKMNKARQAAITTEILEVVGGADALKG